jgi:hypothetical protein
LGEIESQQREPDSLLHASSDLTGSLRHVQLRLGNAPKKKRTAASSIRLAHGWLWHEWFHKTLISKGVPFFHELNLSNFMPTGWSGTADWVFWHPDYHAFILGDLKTAKGESIYWINQRGAKEEHIWQLSAYYYALVQMGLPLVKGFGVMYWPMNDVEGETPVPTLEDCEPLTEDIVLGRMIERWLASKSFIGMDWDDAQSYEAAMEHLAPEQEREQKLLWNKKMGVFDVKLVPHWSTRFCDWTAPYCDCSSQGTTKIGQYDLEALYTPRKGFDEILPNVSPTLVEVARRKREYERNTKET